MRDAVFTASPRTVKSMRSLETDRTQNYVSIAHTNSITQRLSNLTVFTKLGHRKGTIGLIVIINRSGDLVDTLSDVIWELTLSVKNCKKSIA